MTTNTDEAKGREPLSIGFGLEQIGVVAIRHRLIGALIVVALSILCAVGLSRLEFDDELRNIFRADDLDHQTFEQFEATFGNTESDFFVLITGDKLATPEAMAQLREFTFDLRLEDGVASAVSLFSLRTAPDENDNAPTVMPEDIPSGTDLEILFERVDKHPLGLGKLISPDRTATLVIVAIDPDHQSLKDAGDLTARVRQLATQGFEPLGISAEVAGLPVLRIELVERLLQDQVRIIGLGMCMAFLLSGLMFRSLIGAIVTTVPAVIAVVWVIGLMGLIGVKINLTTTILPVLILVLAFADSMHITTDLLRTYAKGKKRKAAAIDAIRAIGPACALTSLTTAIAFLTLTLSESYAIRELGITGSLATLLSFAAVITIGPLLFVLVARGPIAPPSERSSFFRWLGLIAHRTGRIGWRRPLLTVVAGTLFVVIVGVGHSQLRPEFSFHEHLGKDIPTVQAMARINHEFGGSNPVHLMVPLPEAGGVTMPQNLDVIRRIHLALGDFSGTNSVLSFWSVARWLGGESDPEGIRQRLDGLIAAMPENWRSRLYSTDGRLALFTVYFGDEGAATTLSRLSRLEATARAAVPELDIPVRATGFLAISSRESDRMIMQLNLSLVAAVFFGIGLIALAFRSLQYGAVSLLPNLLPILVTGSYLVITAQGLQFSSAIALTIAFGIAVDNSIHLLNRYQRYSDQLMPLAALRAANQTVGPVLVATTIVLCFGIGLTLISQLPMMRLFGRLSVLTLFTALIANLVYLPGLLLFIARRKKT